VALDGNALLLLKIHRVKDLILHVTGRQGIGNLKHSVRQGTLAMVNMGYDAKISCSFHLCRNNPRKDNSNFSIFA
jgi:hypothetical protein